jgi:hypothetical protein
MATSDDGRSTAFIPRPPRTTASTIVTLRSPVGSINCTSSVAERRAATSTTGCWQNASWGWRATHRRRSCGRARSPRALHVADNARLPFHLLG